MSAVPSQEFREKFLMDGNLAILQRGQFLLIVVHENDIVSEVGKTSARHQSYVSRTYNRDPHVLKLP